MHNRCIDFSYFSKQKTPFFANSREGTQCWCYCRKTPKIRGLRMTKARFRRETFQQPNLIRIYGWTVLLCTKWKRNFLTEKPWWTAEGGSSVSMLLIAITPYAGAVMAQWWEHSPSTNVARVRFPVPVSYVGWVCCWFSSLLRGFFSGFSGFPSYIKTNISKFQFHLLVKRIWLYSHRKCAI